MRFILSKIRMSNRTVQTDLVLFTHGHISPQNFLDRMLKDYNEVVVLSAVSCFMQKKSHSQFYSANSSLIFT